MSRLIKRVTTGACAILAISVSLTAQTQTGEGTGSISGRVTLNGQPYSNAAVLLTSEPKDSNNILETLSRLRSPRKTSTDADGHYSFTNLTSGSYEIQVFAPALVGSGHDEPILLGEGEAVDGTDFALTAGGVITGSVLLANGRPAINNSIKLEPMTEEQKGSAPSTENIKAMMKQITSSGASTDDRGVFRIYGVPAGEYLVSVYSGGGRHEGLSTYYPGVTEKTKATAVKVKPGGEASGIDFKLGLSKKGYEVRGRVIDESGNGVPGLMIIVSPAREQGAADSAFSGLTGEGHTNSRGEFKVEGVHPGKYAASVFSIFDETNLYSDTTTFEITSADASGVEIKTHKGLSASGVVVIEGNDDPAVAAQLPQVQLVAAVTSATDFPMGFGIGRATVAPDGTLTITGLRPGKFMIMTSPMAQQTHFSILRIERGGAVQNKGIDISADNPVTDIKVVLGYRNCAIFGRVTLSGGPLPKGTGLHVSIRRLGSDDEGSSPFTTDGAPSVAMALRSGNSRDFTVSPGGDFRADSLVSGDYEVTAMVVPKSGNEEAEVKPATQKVTLVSGAQLEVNLVVDLSPNK